MSNPTFKVNDVVRIVNPDSTSLREGWVIGDEFIIGRIAADRGSNDGYFYVPRPDQHIFLDRCGVFSQEIELVESVMPDLRKNLVEHIKYINNETPRYEIVEKINEIIDMINMDIEARKAFINEQNQSKRKI